MGNSATKEHQFDLTVLKCVTPHDHCTVHLLTGYQGYKTWEIPKNAENYPITFKYDSEGNTFLDDANCNPRFIIRADADDQVVFGDLEFRCDGERKANEKCFDNRPGSSWGYNQGFCADTSNTKSTAFYVGGEKEYEARMDFENNGRLTGYTCHENRSGASFSGPAMRRLYPKTSNGRVHPSAHRRRRLQKGSQPCRKSNVRGSTDCVSS